MKCSVSATPFSIAAVDSDEGILDAVKLLLEQKNWVVRTYRTGDALLRDLEGHKPDCVILEPHLPGTGGPEIAQELTGLRIPVVGLTARPVSPQTIEVIEAGARAMLTKPASEDELVEQILAAIN